VSCSLRPLSCRDSSVSKWAAIILVLELIGAVLISAGAALIFPPAGIIAFGVFVLVFAIAAERSNA
jgi:hypothetical protein